jgi:hypothetical protein
MHGGSRENQYRRSEAQLRNIAARKKGGAFGGRIPLPKTVPPTDSWWTCPESEFKARHTAQMPRMTAITTTYRYSNEDCF